MFFSIFRQAFSHNFLLSPDNLFYIYLQSAFYIPSSRAQGQKGQIKAETDESVKWRNFPRRGAKAKKKADFYSVFFRAEKRIPTKKPQKDHSPACAGAYALFRKDRMKIRHPDPDRVGKPAENSDIIRPHPVNSILENTRLSARKAWWLLWVLLRNAYCVIQGYPCDF